MTFCRTLVAVALFLSAGACRDLSLPETTVGRVSGVASYTDLTGRTVPAAGAIATVVGTSLRVTASSEGAFRIEPITSSVGQLTISFDLDGLSDHQLARTLDFTDWNIVPNREVSLGQVMLRSTATVTGTVLLADAGFDGNAGTEVFVPGQALATTTSDTGLFTLRGVPSGPLALAASRPGYAGQRLDGLLATSGGLLTLAPLVLSPALLEPTLISGRVVPESGADVSSTVALGIDLAGAQAIAVGADGALSGQVRPGRLTVVMRAPGYSDAVVPNLVAEPGTTLDLGAIALARGAFTFDAGLAPVQPGTPRCGDGTTQQGEACDDGNVLSGDGCSERCQLEPQPGGGGQWCLDPQLVTLSGSMDGGLSAIVAVGPQPATTLVGSCLGSARTFAVVLPMRATLSFATSGGVTLRGTLCSSDELQCVVRGGFTSGVLEPGRYVFGVSSLADTTVQVLALPVAPGPFCGDGVRAPMETCDDGNPSAFDACNEQCQLVDQPMESTCGFAPLLTFAPVSSTELGAATQSAQSDLDPTLHASCFDGGTAYNISRFTLPVMSELRIDTPQLSRDVAVAVFSGTCAALREERCTSTIPGQVGGEVLTASLDAGTYFVVVNSPGGAVRTKLTVAPR